MRFTPCLASLLLCAGFAQGQPFPSEIKKGEDAKPRIEMRVAITKVEGKSLTVKKIGTFRSPLTLSLAKDVAVVLGTGSKVEAGPVIEGGLDNPLFAAGRTRALLLLDEKERVREIRVLPDHALASKPVKPELRRIIDPGDPTVISCLAFSPDGQRIVTGELGFGGGTAGDGVRLRMWDIQGRLLWNAPFDARGNSEGVRSVAFSADGSLVVSGSLPGRVHVWDASDGRRLFVGGVGGGGRENPVLAVAVAPDNVVLGAATSGHLSQLDPDAVSGQGGNFAGIASLSAAAFSRDGQYVLTGSEDREAKNAVDKDGKDVISYRVMLWHVESMLVMHTFSVGALRPNGLAFSADGSRILMSSVNEKVIVWERESGKHVFECKGVVAAFSSDNKHIATAGRDHVIRLWELKTGKEVRSFEGHYRDVFALAFSPDGKQLLSGGEETVARLWNVADGKEVRRIGRPVTPLRSLAVSANGKMLLAGGRDGVARAWDLTSGKQVSVFDKHLQIEIARKLPMQTALNVALSPDGKLAATAAHQKTAWIWDPHTGKEVRRLEHESGSHMGRVLFLDNKTLCATVTSTVLTWDIETGKHREGEGTTFNLHEGQLALSSDQGRFLRGYDYGALVWDFDKKKIVREITVPRGVTGVAFAAEDKHAVLLGRDPPKATLWDLETGKSLREYPGHKKEIACVAVSPDGKRVLTGGWDQTVRVHDLDSGELLHTFTGHRKGIRGVAFLPSKDRAVSAGEDGSLRLWDTKTGQALCEMVSFLDGRWAVIDEAGRFDGSDKGQVPWLYYRVGSDIASPTQLHEAYYDSGLLAKHLGTDKTPLREVTPWTKLGLFPQVDARWEEGKKLVIRLTNRGGGIGVVKVFVNGKESHPDARPATFNQDAAQAAIRVDLAGALNAEGANRVQVVGFSKDGSLSGEGIMLER